MKKKKITLSIPTLDDLPNLIRGFVDYLFTIILIGYAVFYLVGLPILLVVAPERVVSVVKEAPFGFLAFVFIGLFIFVRAEAGK